MNMNKTIIVVDDFSFFTGILKNRLTNEFGYNVTAFENPLEALKIFDGRHIDLLISDFMMPHMNGAELTTEIKKIQIYSKLPVLIISSETKQEYKEQAKKAGAFGWLAKPFDIERFDSIVQRILK